jgi:hypothetical protein
MKQYVIKNKAEILRLPMALQQKYKSLLSRPVSSLTPPIQTVGFDGLFEQLDSELKAKGLIHLGIETYFGDEWFCPTQSTAIAIPFWLADERLKQIERELVGFVEGETDDEFMRLMRHEAGHCVDHAYRLSKRSDWRNIFGDPTIYYDPDSVPTILEHPDFVENLSGGYAQTHPEEDFAETFAVWLAPSLGQNGFKSNWRQTYRNRPVALKKLLFVDQLMQEVCEKKPKKLTNQKICNARRMRKSLEKYYSERLQHLEKTRYPNAPLH